MKKYILAVLFLCGIAVGAAFLLYFSVRADVFSLLPKRETVTEFRPMHREPYPSTDLESLITVEMLIQKFEHRLDTTAWRGFYDNSKSVYLEAKKSHDTLHLVVVTSPENDMGTLPYPSVQYALKNQQLIFNEMEVDSIPSAEYLEQYFMWKRLLKRQFIPIGKGT